VTGPAISPQLTVLEDLCKAVLAVQDDSSVDALAAQILRRYKELRPPDRRHFFHFLADQLTVDRDRLDDAVAAYLDDPTEMAVVALAEAVESPRQALFRAMNTAPHGTAAVLGMRSDVLALEDDGLIPVEVDLTHLLQSWFNRGFLTLEALSWDTPAGILEKLIEYEAVHEIRDWDDLQRRLAGDRRCLAFFHPALPGEPLIFVEVALTRGLASSIGEILDEPTTGEDGPEAVDTAVFYSITNCQTGLRGISFGASLIKRAMATLGHELPHLRHFATLSPVPGLRAWIESDDPARLAIDPAVLAVVETFSDSVPPESADPELKRTAAHYLLKAKRDDGYPVDRVARFHLHNGARLSRVLPRADISDKGISESWGVLVNYVYSGEDLAVNHEAYVNAGEIAATDEVLGLV
jgi:malonyl-CoA decarboxylase